MVSLEINETQHTRSTLCLTPSTLCWLKIVHNSSKNGRLSASPSQLIEPFGRGNDEFLRPLCRFHHVHGFYSDYVSLLTSTSLLFNSICCVIETRLKDPSCLRKTPQLQRSIRQNTHAAAAAGALTFVSTSTGHTHDDHGICHSFHKSRLFHAYYVIISYFGALYAFAGVLRFFVSYFFPFV